MPGTLAWQDMISLLIRIRQLYEWWYLGHGSISSANSLNLGCLAQSAATLITYCMM